MLLNAIKREKAKWEICKYTWQRKSMSIIYKKFLQVNNKNELQNKKKKINYMNRKFTKIHVINGERRESNSLETKITNIN